MSSLYGGVTVIDAAYASVDYFAALFPHISEYYYGVVYCPANETWVSLVPW
ncbi:MAG: hypothetical protein QXN24_01925 [Candidatus Bathyarchaeia archaeon]